MKQSEIIFAAIKGFISMGENIKGIKLIKENWNLDLHQAIFIFKSIERENLVSLPEFQALIKTYQKENNNE